MLNKIWPAFLIISFIYAIFTGKLPEVNNSIFESTSNAIQLCLTLVGTMCLWCGIIKIAMETSLVDKLIKLLRPLLRKLFPEIDEKDEVYKEISMNIIANLLGLGNAATPLGLKAMKSLQKTNKNKNELSNSMAILIVLNTASIQLIPTTVIAIRTTLGAKNPTEMLVPIWIATAVAAASAITAAKIFMKKW
ncbi:MAG: nucleoside recognition domain-containing protein [Clostridia bacterium]